MVGVTSSSLVTPIFLHASSVHLLPRGRRLSVQIDPFLHETEGGTVLFAVSYVVGIS